MPGGKLLISGTQTKTEIIRTMKSNYVTVETCNFITFRGEWTKYDIISRNESSRLD